MFIAISMQARGQDVPDTFVLPSYSVEVSFLAYQDENNDDLFIGGFHLFEIESGFYFNLGKDNESKDKILVNVEPLYVRLTNNLFGIGALRTGVEFRF